MRKRLTFPEITILIRKDDLALIDLDFGELTVESVSVNNSAAEFEHSAGRLNLKLSKGLAFPVDTYLKI